MVIRAEEDYAHIGPGTLAGRYLRSFWQPVMRGCDLEVGWAKPLRILGEDFTIYRGESGKPHIIDFRCAHRGTQLSTGWVEGDCVRCFYHGWKYDETGQCVEQPCEREGLASRVRIGGYPAREYHGLIFGYLGEGEPPEFPAIPPFDRPGLYYHVDTFTRGCNYFQILENHTDDTHLSFVHRDSAFGDIGLADIPKIEVEETEYGILRHGIRSGGRIREHYFYMPNAGWIIGSPDAEGISVENIRWRVPVDDVSTVTFVLSKLEGASPEQAERWSQRIEEGRGAPREEASRLAERILAGELQTSALIPAAKAGYGVGCQDEVAQIGQGPIADREHERLGSSDVGVAMLRRIWKRELSALAEGRAIKRWRVPENLRATAGV